MTSFEKTTLEKRKMIIDKLNVWVRSICMCAVVIAMSGIAYSGEGHSDVEFAYEDGKIAVEFGDEGPVFEGDFPTEGIDLQYTSEPGFASELEEGMGIGAEDQIIYNVVSDLMYWNEGFQAVPNNAEIRIINRPPAPLVPDTIIGAATGDQDGGFDPAVNRIGNAELDGDFHSDLDIFLDPKGESADPSMYGAYGFMITLGTDAEGIADSDPFAMVFNYGLDEETFEEGVEAMANLVPEPTGSVSILLALASGLACFRRRKG